MSQIDPTLANFDQLRGERDWSHETMGDHLEKSDPKLAAVYRQQFIEGDDDTEGDDDAKSPKPRGRRSAPKSEA